MFTMMVFNMLRFLVSVFGFKTMVFFFWMVLLYLFLLGIILYVYYKWNKMRYVQKLRLRDEELKYQTKILEIELKAESELKIQEYEKHILELELQTNTEVTGKSLSIETKQNDSEDSGYFRQ
jgi:cbb3-type cytochrome oxidase subunit 3